jgi:dTDP-4-dehydrorhamnose reductase
MDNTGMWLLVGGDSEIGAATSAALSAQGLAVAATTRRRDLVAADRPFLDLAAPLDDWEPPPRTSAACIFAAVARLAACAADPAASAYINVTQTLALADRLIERDIPLLFLSTNQVFDGRTPNVPADAPACPVSEYGRQKARAEAHLRERMDAGARVAILRLAKVISPGMPLLRGWIASLAAGRPIRAFDDMTMAPVPAQLVTAAIGSLLHDKPPGIFQLTGARDVSYAQVGLHLAERLAADRALVVPASAHTSGLPIGAAPRHTTLDSTALRERLGRDVPDVWAVIETIVERVEGS